MSFRKLNWGLAALLLCLCAALYAQNGANKPPTVPGTNGTWMVVGYSLTTTGTNVCGLAASSSITPPPCNQTVFLCGADLNAGSATSVTTTILDGAGNYFWNAVAALSSSAASSYNIPFGGAPSGCRPFPKGLVVSASSGSTITFSGWGTY